MYDPGSRLFLPEYWFRLSNDAKIAAYNGVGPEFFPDWLRGILDTIYYWASDPVGVHDVEYNYSRSRIMADLRLLANCLLNSRGKIRRIVLSLIAFAGVALFGRRAWKEGHIIAACELTGDGRGRWPWIFRHFNKR